MADGGTTEIIWHFAGFLRLIEESPASRSSYDTFHHGVRVDDFKAGKLHEARPGNDLPELTSKPAKFTLPDVPPVPFDAKLLANDADAAKLAVQAHHAAPHEPSDFSAPHGGGGGIPAPQMELHYSVSYEDGGNDKLATITQSNFMDDDDVLVDTLVQGSGEGLSEMHTIDIPETLSGMLDKAHAATPDDLVPVNNSAFQWKELVETHDAAIRHGGDVGTVDEGTYVNGEAVSGKPPELPDRPELPSTGEPGTQVMEAGGNTAINAAVIADLNEATGTLIVLGDYYETNAIVQSNIYSDNDQTLPGTAHAAQASTGDNLAANIASLVAEEVAGQRGTGIGPWGLSVNVTIADGDLYDVKALTQRNWISDNDEAVQTTSDAFSATYVGGNQQVNAAKFVDLANYDVIIVLGNYHDFNMISQTNILIDDDILGATGGGSGVGDANLHGGRNHLLNDASIENHGVNGFKDLTGDLESLINSINGHGTPGLHDWASLAGSASGRLDVLVVRGDYWDINVISQTNVIVDADVGLQHLADGGGSQWMNTGGNTAHNMAQIIDVGGIFDQYLGGHHYTDAVMIQAEYMDASSTVVNNDTMSLISEAVAFAGGLDQSLDDESLDSALGHVGHDDMMGAVLT